MSALPALTELAYGRAETINRAVRLWQPTEATSASEVFTEECLESARTLRGIWESFRKELSSTGLNTLHISSHCQALIVLSEAALCLLSVVRDTAPDNRRAELEGAEADIRDVQNKAEKWLARVQAPPAGAPGISPERALEALEALERGEGRPHADVYARLRDRP